MVFCEHKRATFHRNMLGDETRRVQLLLRWLRFLPVWISLYLFF